MRNPRLAAMILLVAVGSGSAATLEQMSLDRMISESTAVVRGSAIESRAVRSGALIFTVTRFHVAEQWKGKLAAQIEIWLPGGQVGSLNQSFGGVPRLPSGQEFVAFLWTGPSGRTQIIGLSQGLFSVEKRGVEVVAVRNASADLMLEPQSYRPVQNSAIRMPVGELKERVTAEANNSQ